VLRRQYIGSIANDPHNIRAQASTPIFESETYTPVQAVYELRCTSRHDVPQLPDQLRSELG